MRKPKSRVVPAQEIAEHPTTSLLASDYVQPAPRRDWMTNPDAVKYAGTPEKKAMVNGAIAILEWHEATDELVLPMSPGLFIQGAIKQFRIPRVSHVAWRGGMLYGRYSVYGIEAHYGKGGRQWVRLYFMDRGSDGICLCTDVWPEVTDAG